MMKKTKSAIESRISLLQNRGRDNGNIVKKLKRKLRKFN